MIEMKEHSQSAHSSSAQVPQSTRVIESSKHHSVIPTRQSREGPQKGAITVLFHENLADNMALMVIFYNTDYEVIRDLLNTHQDSRRGRYAQVFVVRYPVLRLNID